MSNGAILVAATIGIFVVVPVALLLARDWFVAPSKKQLDADSRRFKERLENPDFAAIAKHFGRPLPACVQALYADRLELLRGNFAVAPDRDSVPDDRWYVAFYQPADEESARESWSGTMKYFAFANDGFGNEYLIDPTGDDPPVVFHDHETGEILAVCDRFTEFMRWPRLDQSS